MTDTILALVNACAAELRERGYTVVDHATRPEEGTVYVTTRPDPKRPYQIFAAVGAIHASRCCFAHAADKIDALALAFDAWLPKVPDLVERERLLDATLGIVPARAEAA